MTYYSVYYSMHGYGDLLDITDNYNKAVEMVQDCILSAFDDFSLDGYKSFTLEKDDTKFYGYTLTITDNDGDKLDYDAFIECFTED